MDEDALVINILTIPPREGSQLVETSIRLFSGNHVTQLKSMNLQKGDIILFLNAKKLASKGGYYLKSMGEEEVS